MNIGIYLGFGREYKEYSLTDQGLGRYLAFLVRGLAEGGNYLTIAYPYWYKIPLKELLSYYHVDIAKVTYLEAELPMSAWELYLDFLMRKQRQPKANTFGFSPRKMLSNVLSRIVQIHNPIVLFACFFLMLLIIVLLSPLICISICLLVGPKMIIRFIKKSKGILKKYLMALKLYNHALWVRQEFEKQLDLTERVRLRLMSSMVKMINNRDLAVDIWFSPMMFWPEFDQIRGTKVVAVPDLVTVPFAFGYSKYKVINTTNNCRDTLRKGTNFITYCNYVRDTLLVKEYQKHSDRIKVIPHANNETISDINVSDSLIKFNPEYDVNKHFARRILQTLPMKASIRYSSYFEKYSFADLKYIFYSSQVRPNKNMLNLFKAYEYLLRKKHYNIKLITTGNLEHSTELLDYVHTANLHFDILSFNGVSVKQLSALYACAELVVNPTLYEGGFPFTFAEGMSVGTPSVMSNIPQVKEVCDGWGMELYLFDPYRWEDIAEKIEYGLNHKEELVKNQLPLYKHLAERTWEVVAREYVDVFKYFLHK
jgi:glycosyltransferase involved in cell wall biosynthesis